MEYYEHKLDPVGTRPDWLSDDDLFAFSYKSSSRDALIWFPEDSGPLWKSVNVHWNQCISLRLPLDHWAVPALKQGFKPWAGGDSAPGDWDGGEVLTLGRSRGKVSVSEHAGKYKDYWQHAPHRMCIIGYKPKATTEEKPDEDTRLMAIIERIASNGVASITDVRECEAIVAERRPVDPLFEALCEARLSFPGVRIGQTDTEALRQALAKHNLKIVEA